MKLSTRIDEKFAKEAALCFSFPAGARGYFFIELDASENSSVEFTQEVEKLRATIVEAGFTQRAGVKVVYGEPKIYIRVILPD